MLSNVKTIATIISTNNIFPWPSKNSVNENILWKVNYIINVSSPLEMCTKTHGVLQQKKNYYAYLGRLVHSKIFSMQTSNIINHFRDNWRTHSSVPFYASCPQNMTCRRPFKLTILYSRDYPVLSFFP